MPNTKVITLEDVENVENAPKCPSEVSTLRLRMSQEPSSEHSWMSESEKWVESFVKKINEGQDIDLDQNQSASATQANKEKLRQYHERLRVDLEKQFKRAADSMDRMSLKEQEQLLFYWDGVSTFLTKVLDWIKDMFMMVINKIMEGFKLLKKTLEGLFDMVSKAIRTIFGD